MGGKGTGKGKAVWKVKEVAVEEPEPKKAAGKGKEKGKAKPSTTTTTEERKYAVDTKPYAELLQPLFEGTVARSSDIDAKSLQLLDWLYDAGKVEPAVAHVKKAITGLEREKVERWNSYLYALFRGFDKELYNQAREARGHPEKSRRDRERKPAPIRLKPEISINTPLNPSAAEFVPGQLWGLNFGGSASPASAPAEEAAAPVANGSADKAADTGESKADSEGTIFEVECKTEEGQQVLVVGGTSALGDWKPEGAVALSCEGTTQIWKSKAVKLDGTVEYKFIMKKGDDVTWEGIEGNRKVTSGEQPKATKFGEPA